MRGSRGCFAPGHLVYGLFDKAGTAQDQTIIYGDTNGDALAGFQIELKGLHVLHARDFIL